jgi:hypothetical protein
MSSPDKRRARLAALRKEGEESDRRRLELIKKKLERNPPIPLKEHERAVLLRVTASPQLSAGKPALLEEFHRWIAIHYWWLYPQRHTAKMVAKEWDSDVKTVRKYAAEQKEAATQTVQVFKAAGPPAAVEKNLELMAQLYRKLGE